MSASAYGKMVRAGQIDRESALKALLKQQPYMSLRDICAMAPNLLTTTVRNTPPAARIGGMCCGETWSR